MPNAADQLRGLRLRHGLGEDRQGEQERQIVGRERCGQSGSRQNLVAFTLRG